MNLESDHFMESIKAAMDRGPPQVRSASLLSAFLTRSLFLAGMQQDSDTRETPKQRILRQTMGPFIEHGPAPRLENLKPISLREIARKINCIHSGRVLFAMTERTPYRVVGTNLLIRDENEDVIQAGIYNFIRHNQDPSVTFPNGTCIALLEPYMKHSQDNPDAPLMLRCDNPQCVVIFDSKHVWQQAKKGCFQISCKQTQYTAHDLRQQGNDFFRKGDMEKALKSYTNAIGHTDVSIDDKVASLSNRAEVFLRMQLWEKAEADCRQVLKIDADHVKAKFRLAKALLRLNKITDGYNLLLCLKKEHKIEDKTLMKDANRLMKESRGNFNFDTMRRQSCGDMFHADYTSDAVDFGTSVTRPSIRTYRGCTAKEDIA